MKGKIMLEGDIINILLIRKPEKMSQLYNINS